MTENNNKSLSQSPIGEETRKHKIVELRMPPPVLSVASNDITESITTDKASDLRITELELLVEELKNELKKAQTAGMLFDHSPAVLFTLKADGIIEHLNERAATLLGEELPLKSPCNIREYLSTGSLADVDNFLRKAFITGTRQTCELTFIAKGNPADIVPIHLEGFAPDKERCHLTAIIQDKQGEAERSEPICVQDKNPGTFNTCEAFYHKLFESSKDGILILDAENGHILDVNPFFTHLLGYSCKEIKNKSLYDIGIFNCLSDYNDMMNELQDKGHIRYDNILLSTKNGKPVYVEFTGHSYLVNLQKVVQCNLRNITERIKAEKEIHTLHKAIEQGPSAIIITDAKGKIEFVNNKFVELTQYQPSEVMGKNPRIFNPGHLPEEQYVELWRTLKSGKTWEGKVMDRRKDNTRFWEEITISPVKDLDGTISNYILLQNDISEKQQIIDDLIKAKEKAEEGDLLKTAFLANMSHEIRTPLNSIIGFSELMVDEDFDYNQLNHFAKIIRNSGNKLLSIINDIMDLSRIEAGEIKVEKRRLSVNQLIKNIQKEYLFRAVEKGIDLKIDPSALCNEVFIESDENKLRQILINFVGNAIKFTEKGSIEIGLKVYDGFIHIQVQDTGIGIPAHFQERIFERFRQVESAYSKKYGGNGLGLAISKALVELLGGHIGMETEYGKGSTFFFTVPIA